MGRLQDVLTQNGWKRSLMDRITPLRREMASAYASGKALAYASPEEIAGHQQQSLRRLLALARRAPYWRDVLADFDTPVERFTLDDLARLPFLTKRHLRERAESLLAPGARGVYENFSGGSTGAPVRFFQDRQYKIHMSASTRLCNEMAGAFPGARFAKLWGAPQDRRRLDGLTGRMKLWLLNQRYYDSFDMSPARMELYHRRMEKFQPDLIQAYSSSLYLLARYLQAKGVRPSYPRRAIITSAERLFPHMRETIEAVFPVRVFDRYGSREVSAMAAECEHHDGLHVQMPGYIVETIDPKTGRNVTGTPGEIVVTVLNNFAMPFIRYRIGDMGVINREPCACGRNTWRLREILGRSSDNFLLPNGRIVHGEYFTHLLYGRAGIEEFQFVQETAERFRLRLVPTNAYTDAIGRDMETRIREAIGPRARFEIEICHAIPKTASGKYRFTVSLVDVHQMIAGEALR